MLPVMARARLLLLLLMAAGAGAVAAAPPLVTSFPTALPRELVDALLVDSAVHVSAGTERKHGGR